MSAVMATGAALAIAGKSGIAFGQANKPAGGAGLEQDKAGQVTRLQGSAIALQDATPRILSQGAVIQLGDVISTGADSRLELKMIDDTVFTLGARTNFVVMEYEFQNNAGLGAVRLISGAINAVTGQLAKVQGAPLKVETNFGTIGIRGTEFWAGTTVNGDFEIAMWEGAGVTIVNRAGQSEIRQPNDGILIEGPDIAPQTPVFWSFEKRQDAMALVAFR